MRHRDVVPSIELSCGQVRQRPSDPHGTTTNASNVVGAITRQAVLRDLQRSLSLLMICRVHILRYRSR